MPPIDKDHIKRGIFLNCGSYAVARIERAALPSGPPPRIEAAAREADRLAVSVIREVERRLAEARAMLEQLRAVKHSE